MKTESTNETLLQQNQQLRFQNQQLQKSIGNLANVQNGLLNDIARNFNRLDIIPNKIIFISFDGKGYGDNPKYIAEEILRCNYPYDLVWALKDINEPLPAKIRRVIYNSVDFMYELATAKVIVTNEMTLLPFIKKFGQFFIMTWHGTFGLKHINAEMLDKMTPQFLDYLKKSNAFTDLMLADSEQNVEHIRKAFLYRGNILTCGMPRQDIFFGNNDKLIAQVRKNLGIPDSNKVLIYAPTFREDMAKTFDVCTIDYQKLSKVLKKKFGGDWTILLRFHPIISDLNYSRAANTIDVTKYPDMQELILVSDILITDYSSVVYDFMISKKPVFFFAKDVETYRQERGLKEIYFNMPYKINETEDELFKSIKNFDSVTTQAQVDRMLAERNPVDNGHASEEVVHVIRSVIDGYFSQFPTGGGEKINLRLKIYSRLKKFSTGFQIGRRSFICATGTENFWDRCRFTRGVAKRRKFFGGVGCRGRKTLRLFAKCA